MYKRQDLVNIQTFVRLKRIGKPFAFFEQVFVAGGMPSGFYETFYPKPLAEFLAALGSTLYSALSDLGGSGFTMTELERKTDEILGNYLKKLRRVPFGPEVPVAYLLSKESEIKNIRIVMSGKFCLLYTSRCV